MFIDFQRKHRRYQIIYSSQWETLKNNGGRCKRCGGWDLPQHYKTVQIERLIMRNTKLFIISFLLLFLELMCIRWLSTEIRIFAYFQNFVLIACFLGFGIGCSLPRLRYPIYLSVLLLAVFAIMTGYLHLFESGSQILGFFHDYHIVQTHSIEIPILDSLRHFIVIGLLFFLLVMTFVPVGVILGQLLEGHSKPLLAYSINVAGSLVGIWVYTLVCYFDTPPLVWFLISSVLLLFFAWDQKKNFGLAIIGILLALLFVHQSPEKDQTIWWSPYQKLTLSPLLLDVDRDGKVLPTVGTTDRQIKYGYNLTANQTHIQFLEDMNIYPRFYGNYNRYSLPYHLAADLEDVLILGAGCGNDVESAIRMNVKHIDAVEIDPLIVEIGKTYHPNKPYINHPNVNVIVDDARSFLKKTTKKYDLICFSLLDAHTLTSGFTNIRLDDYVYTIESFKEAKDCLKPGGIVSMRFWTEQPFTALRLFKNMAAAFHQEPYVFWLEGMYYISGSQETIQRNIINTTNPELAGIFSDRERALDFLRSSPDTPPSQDDWPYLYLRNYQIPMAYVLIITVLLLTSLLILKFVVPGKLAFNSHFFFLGSGFLLIEVQNISRISLLFGSTWVVNSIIFSIILLMVLLGNLIVGRFKLTNSTPIYYALTFFLVLSFFFSIASVLQFNPILRGLIAGLVVCLPLFTASMIFAISFSQTKNLNTAFGSNMTGTVLGGVCSCLSFVIGIKALLLVGMCFYGITFITRKKLA